MPLVGIAWSIFAIARYVRYNALFKTGLAITASGILFGVLAQLTSNAVLADRATGVVVTSSPALPLMLSIGGVGLLITGIGFLVGKFKGGKK